MSLRAGCEVLVMLHSFRNIDLRNQGLYCLDLKLVKAARQQTDEVINGQPYLMTEVQRELRCRKKGKIRAEPDLFDTNYYSKTFLIRYNDEEMDLEELVVFRMELNNFPDIQNDLVELVFSLRYAECDPKDQPTNKLMGSSSLPLKKVATKRLRLNNLDKGICDFACLVFDTDNMCQVNLSVFTMVMDCRFRIFKSNKKRKTSDEIKRQKISSLSQFYSYANQKIENCVEHFYSRYIKQIRYHSYNTKSRWAECVSRPMPNPIKVPKNFQSNQMTGEDIEATPQDFFKYFGSYHPKKMQFKFFQMEMEQTCLDNHKFIQQFIQAIQKGELKTSIIKQRYMVSMKDRCGQYIFRNHLMNSELQEARLIGKEKKAFATRIRKKSHYQNLNCLNIEDIDAFPDIEQQPIIFHDITKIKQAEPWKKHKHVLFVFVHGFQGSLMDLKRVRNNMKLFYPGAYFLLSRANQADTLSDIGKMGQNLANQIKQYIKLTEISEDLLLHLVGHSMGGIIVRAALPHLRGIKLGTYASFSSPHLGYLYGTSNLIDTGMWFLKKVKKTLSLEQLTMGDSKNPEDSFMFLLSESGSLRNFRQVVLISSFQDTYVPWHSARIQSYKGQANEKKTHVQNSMILSLLDGVSIEEIHRIEISYQIPEKNLDSVLGRAAHIELLSNDLAIRMILFCMPQLFSG